MLLKLSTRLGAPATASHNLAEHFLDKALRHAGKNSMMAPRIVLVFFAIWTLITLFAFYRASAAVRLDLSPQGCRMSWMSPSYILQKDFDASWTPLARRYSLWKYREVGWELNEAGGMPVLFVPGNAGSSHQVRSIASSATRQFYTSPYVKASEFEERPVKPLDFFAVEFNEDFSAFHGPTLDAQISYCSRAISYILSLYPANMSIVIMGHSMGGIVASALLPSDKISAVITMSTPHTLPPARFDSRIDRIYEAHKRILQNDPTPVVSLCGGATDMQIPSESCILPEPERVSFPDGVYRKTVFTSALEGAWTGVGHREMVWCHQVRWRVARAALELSSVSTQKQHAAVLDTWLRDGKRLPLPGASTDGGLLTLSDPTSYEMLPAVSHLVLSNIERPHTYLMPIPGFEEGTEPKFILYLSHGSIAQVSHYYPLPLSVSVFLCDNSGIDLDADRSFPTCRSLLPTTLKLLPNPIPEQPFPIPNEGTDESEGLVFFEADIPVDVDWEPLWVGVRIEDADGRGSLVGGFLGLGDNVVGNRASIMDVVFGGVSVTLPFPDSLRTHISLPKLLSNVLIVYRLTPKFPLSASTRSCSGPLLQPLLMHTSEPSEAHYFRLTDSVTPLLHTHSSAPFIPSSRHSQRRGVNMTVYSSGVSGCGATELQINIDWWATFGRWGPRYMTSVISWTIGLVALVEFQAWRVNDNNGRMPDVAASLSAFASTYLPKYLIVAFLASLIPLPSDYFLGNMGEPIFAPLAPLILFLAFGLVYICWSFLQVLMWPLTKIGTLTHSRWTKGGLQRSTIISMCLIFLLIFLFIPWQVAFLGSWMIHLYNCATSARPTPNLESAIAPSAMQSIPIPVIRISRAESDDDSVTPTSSNASDVDSTEQKVSSLHWRQDNDNFNHKTHMLLVMTCLLPLTLPVLAVWVRTLATAGLTTPFDGDHNFLNVASFLIFVDFASWNTGPLFEMQRFERTISCRWLFMVLAYTAFSTGSKATYSVYDTANIAITIVLLVRIGRRYIGGSSWYL